MHGSACASLMATQLSLMWAWSDESCLADGRQHMHRTRQQETLKISLNLPLHDPDDVRNVASLKISLVASCHGACSHCARQVVLRCGNPNFKLSDTPLRPT